MIFEKTINIHNIKTIINTYLILLDKEFYDEFHKYTNYGLECKDDIFEKLKVGVYDECNHNGYTLVALAIMIWGLRMAIDGDNFENIIKKIISAGGDADTNAAITGAVLGSYFGYSNLPQDWIKSTPNKTWLDKKITDFLTRQS